MENDFTNIARKIEQRRLAITEALQREMNSLAEVEKTLNRSYKESVQSVLNSLKNNMEEQEKELGHLLQKKQETQLQLIDQMLQESRDRLKNKITIWERIAEWQAPLIMGMLTLLALFLILKSQAPGPIVLRQDEVYTNPSDQKVWVPLELIHDRVKIEKEK